ncbi:MAG TPA: YtxH domain-containing protein [Sphingobacteriaceae bacterium]
MSDNTKILVALLAGAAAGAALGILFAPDSGSETRDKVSDALRNLSDTIRDRVAEEIENLAGMKDQVVDEVKQKFGKEESTYQGVPNPSTTQSDSYSS